MTYGELADYINAMSNEEKNMDVTIYVRGVDEFYPAEGDILAIATDAQDVLDPGHPYLVI